MTQKRYETIIDPDATVSATKVGTLKRFYRQANGDGHVHFYDYELPFNTRWDIRYRKQNEDWWRFFQTIDILRDTEDAIVFSVAPSLAVSEGSIGQDIPDVHYNKDEFSVAILSFTSLSPAQGRLSQIRVDYKKSTDSTYRILQSLEFEPSLDEVENDESAATYKVPIQLLDKPTNYDFRAVFMNGNGITAKTGDSPVVASHTGVAFNGVSDLAEYVAVTGLKMVNADDQDGSPTGYLMASDQAVLEWDDIREEARSSFPLSSTDALGNPVQVTYQQSRRASAYVVYMFVSTAGSAPEHEYPGTSDANGTWYYMTETKKNYASIPIQLGQNIAFWVGFRTEATSTGVPKTTKEL